jgi:hypothetical protein
MKKWEPELNRELSKEKLQMSSKYMKKWLQKRFKSLSPQLEWP